MKSIKAIALIATVLLAADLVRAEVFTIGGFKFDDANCARTAAIVAGPKNLKIQNSRFGKYSDAYLKDASVRLNEFATFNRSTSIGWLLQPSRVPGNKANLHAKSVALPNGQKGERSVIELTWGGNGLRNASGIDFVIFASGSAENFAVSVLREGDTQFSRAKYQLADAYDPTHEAAVFAFDLREFSVADGELVRAVRIQNVVSGPSSAADKVDANTGQGMLLSASDTEYKRGFPLLQKTNEIAGGKTTIAHIVYLAALRDVEPLERNGGSLQDGSFTIAGFTFNPSNSVKRAFIVEGPANLKVRPSALFAPHANPVRASVLNYASAYTIFERKNTVGQLLRNHFGTAKNSRATSMHVMFPDVEAAPPTPNVDRCAIELNWDGAALPNKPGSDFVIYEVDHWEGFAVSVQRKGSTQWSRYRYQFTNGCDTANAVNAVAFDLSKFGLRENEEITALRIRNLFSSRAVGGGDKVDNVTGQGTVIFAKDPNYRSGFPLLMKPNGKEFTADLLDADIAYVVGLHDLNHASAKIAANP